MKRSLLSALVAGTRSMLAVQLLVAIFAVALAGWTLGVTSNLMRERDRLRERVIQLEQTMADRGIVAPAPPAVVADARSSEALYPDLAANAASVDGSAATAPAPEGIPQVATREFSRIIGDLFAPAPALQTIVLHVRAAADADQARALGQQLQESSGVRVLINVMAPADQRASGYSYYDGRQNSAAAGLVTRFHDAAREAQIAVWSAQLRGVALPAKRGFSAARLDIVLPPLPPPPEPPPPAVTAPAPG
ncbi:MAG: hypothetical protein JNJ63_00890 [Hyphomonadaceae bacterium]|nr:hypothetical protein [Hyphomonadaceae bacterium]